MNTKKKVIYLLDEDEENIETRKHCLCILSQLKHILTFKVYRCSESALILHTKLLVSQFKNLAVLPSSMLLGLWSGIQRRAQQRCSFFISNSMFGSEWNVNEWERELYLALATYHQKDALLALEKIRSKAKLQRLALNFTLD